MKTNFPRKQMSHANLSSAVTHATGPSAKTPVHPHACQDSFLVRLPLRVAFVAGLHLLQGHLQIRDAPDGRLQVRLQSLPHGRQLVHLLLLDKHSLRLESYGLLARSPTVHLPKRRSASAGVSRTCRYYFGGTHRLQPVPSPKSLRCKRARPGEGTSGTPTPRWESEAR